MEEVIETSYSRGGLNASLTSSVSKVTMMNMLKDLVIPERDYVVFKKKRVDYLYIDADEDHIALQREEKFSEINKLIYVYEGIENESSISERKRLINTHYFGRICTKEGENSMLWQEVYNYIAEAYEIDKIKMIYINGDGASWIKTGVYHFKRAKFVMDKFHITEHVIGCSAEGHISHVLASRMSSRPMGWTIDGANKLTKLRLYKLNGGYIYILVKALD